MGIRTHSAPLPNAACRHPGRTRGHAASRRLRRSQPPQTGAVTRVADAVAAWTAKRDFRWVASLMELLPTDARAAAETVVTHARDQARTAILGRMDELSSDIERAMIEGSIDADSRA